MTSLPAMRDATIEKVRLLETEAAKLPQTPIATSHMPGLYARTVMVPAGHMITGVLIKIPTALIVSGDALMAVEGGTEAPQGYNVLAMGANRKQAMVAISDVWLTMLFATSAETVEEAEAEFTDETGLLVSRHDGADNEIVMG